MSDLISILYGSSTTTTSTQSAYTYYQMLQNNGEEQLEKFTQQDSVQEEVSYFQERVAEIETPEEFLEDDRLVKFVLSAFSMDDEFQYMGRLKKILLEDSEDEDALVNQMSDARFGELADFLQFDSRGMDRIQLGSIQQEAIEKYYVNEWEKSLEEVNPALRKASYFARNIDNVTSTYGLLSDSVLASVTRDTLGLIDESVYQSVERQAAEIDNRVELEDLSSSYGTSDDDEESETVSESKLSTASSDLTSLSDALLETQTIESDMSNLEELMLEIQTDFEFASSLSTATGDLADQITFQTDNVDEWYDAENFMSVTNYALSEISDRMDSIQSYLDDTTDSNLSSNQSRVSTLYQEIQDIIGEATYKRSSDGAEINVFDADYAINVQTTETGTAYEMSGIDTTTLLNRLDSIATNYASASSTDDVTALQQASASMSNAAIDLETLSGALTNRQEAYAGLMENVDNMVSDVDTETISDARVAISDAIVRSQDVINIANDLRDLALESVELAEGSDRTEIQEQYTSLRDELFSLIATPSYGDINLLASDGTEQFEYKEGGSIWLETTDLATTLSSYFPETLEEGGEASILNGIDQAKEIANDTIDSYSLELATVSTLATEFDPLGAVNSKLEELKSTASALLEDEVDEDGNVTSTSIYASDAEDQDYSIESTGETITVRSVSNFEADVLANISNAADNLFTDPTQALKDLRTALYATQDIGTDTRADARSIRSTTTDVEAIKEKYATESASDETYSLLNFNSDETRKFIERYLITMDSEESESSSSNSYVLSLFA